MGHDVEVTGSFLFATQAYISAHADMEGMESRFVFDVRDTSGLGDAVETDAEFARLEHIFGIEGFDVVHELGGIVAFGVGRNDPAVFKDDLDSVFH